MTLDDERAGALPATARRRTIGAGAVDQPVPRFEWP